MIRGLNEKFTSIGLHLQRGRPFPTFLEARNDLLLEELNQVHRSSMPWWLLARSVLPRCLPLVKSSSLHHPWDQPVLRALLPKRSVGQTGSIGRSCAHLRTGKRP
jgi:hypothetical protein